MNKLQIYELIETDLMFIPKSIYTEHKETNAKTILLSSLLFNHVIYYEQNNIKYIAINIAETCEYLRIKTNSLLYTLKRLQKFNLLKIIKIYLDYVTVEWIYEINEILSEKYVVNKNYEDYEEY